MSSKGPHICPNCKERVSAFAAGCAICGTQLDPHRADRRASALTRLGRRRKGPASQGAHHRRPAT